MLGKIAKQTVDRICVGLLYYIRERNCATGGLDLQLFAVQLGRKLRDFIELHKSRVLIIELRLRHICLSSHFHHHEMGPPVVPFVVY